MICERRDGPIVWVSFDRPERLNAFTGPAYRDLHTVLRRCQADGEIRAVILTGRGRAFSVGADRSLLDPNTPDEDRRIAGDEFTVLLDVLATFNKPLFAAVNGLAVGFGATMLLYCDVVLVAESARMRLPFTELGIVPEAGSSVLLAGRVRWADAMWSVLSSEWIDAEAAHAMGLALRVIPDADLLEAAAAAANTVARLDPAAVAATKRLMTAGRGEIARQAISRELSEMRDLASRAAR
ncbi:enoyl-CoA hydratase/isomerase family protein [Mycobacterium sp. CVI_P3]|uniref:Enoyl-CoA hydratase/isomerase family protein n=1 Tax=Mycobacterium pinniadriaticum TaxID=2994102 RepID=A0ABT3S7V9_9MYCO|nr:enoyl-CoA hydratase/isomerase family protein [Mycobacterium pinniadriaticum]MCX2929161.1 enoyl-CoA hydratase/isomerase family protein [Mycobacterium pinniadriaticum]MCX2935586.1 enoyl-CoA hydratase/isomerase family protein [Mycobacterium pinniadriaticum]